MLLGTWTCQLSLQNQQNIFDSMHVSEALLLLSLLHMPATL